MKIWYQDRPLLSLVPAGSELPGTITPVPEGTVVLEGDGADPTRVLSMVPDGTYQFTPNHGPYELMTTDPAINTLNYGQNGCPMKIAYRVR